MDIKIINSDSPMQTCILQWNTEAEVLRLKFD